MASDVRLDLMVNGTAATTASLATLWGGGRGVFIVSASTFGGGSVKLQYKAPDAVFVDVPLVTLSAVGMVGFELPPGELKAVQTTATNSYVYAIGTRVD